MRNYRIYLLGLFILLAAHPAMAADPVSLDVMFAKLVGAMQGPTVRFISYAAACIGIAYFARGLLKFSKISDGASRQTFNNAIVTLIIGAALISFPQTITTLVTTFNLSSAPDNPILSYDTSLGIDPAVQTRINNVTLAVFAFVQILGLISVVRGFAIFREVSEGGNNQVTLPAGFTHLIAGCFAFNLVDIMRMLQTTLGISILH